MVQHGCAPTTRQIEPLTLRLFALWLGLVKRLEMIALRHGLITPPGQKGRIRDEIHPLSRDHWMLTSPAGHPTEFGCPVTGTLKATSDRRIYDCTPGPS